MILKAIDHSKGRHLFVTRGISAEAQTDHAVRLATLGDENKTYVHHHGHLEACNDKCRVHTAEDIGGHPVIESNDLTEE